MALPAPVWKPAFNVTRASHVVLSVRDLKASRLFYTEVIGLIVTREEDDALYLRGVEEACHHSLVLRKSAASPTCARIGLRVQTEADLDAAFDWFARQGLSARFAEVAHQGRTLQVTDPVGVPLEFCAQMPAQERQITNFLAHRGGCGQRIDHYQMLTPRVPEALAFYAAMGFRLSEYLGPSEEDIRGVFLQRKGNPHDIVFFTGEGPRLHHFAYFSPEVHHLLRACDVAGALGFGRDVERGPGRPGPGHAMYVYFRDPDGHRVELFNTHYQIMDLENEPVRWDPADPNVSFPWGLPAQSRWFEEATCFEGADLVAPNPRPTPMTLEAFLAANKR